VAKTVLQPPEQTAAVEWSGAERSETTIGPANAGGANPALPAPENAAPAHRSKTPARLWSENLRLPVVRKPHSAYGPKTLSPDPEPVERAQQLQAPLPPFALVQSQCVARKAPLTRSPKMHSVFHPSLPSAHIRHLRIYPHLQSQNSTVRGAVVQSSLTCPGRDGGLWTEVAVHGTSGSRSMGEKRSDGAFRARECLGDAGSFILPKSRLSQSQNSKGSRVNGA
jgi:hypothetical protein